MTGVFGTDFTDFVGLGCRLGGQAFLIVVIIVKVKAQRKIRTELL